MNPGRPEFPLGNKWALVLVILCAFALRLYHLDHVDLRGDEAFDVLYASQHLREVIRNDLCCQMYPPLLHTTLHYWLLLAGNSEFAFRFLYGLLPGVLLVPITFCLGRELFSARVGFWAALFAAANPYLLWWAQDGHFYSALAAISAAVLWLGLRALRRRAAWTALATYVFVAILGLYTHYFVAFALTAVNILAFTFLRRLTWDRRATRRWLLAQATIVVVLLPWVYLSLDLMQRFQLGWAPPVTLWGMLWRDALAYNLGPMPLPGKELVTAAILAVGFLGLTIPRRTAGDGREDHDALPLAEALILLLFPLLIFWLISLLRPMFDEKFTIFTLPVYLVLLARAADRLRFWRGAKVLAILLVLATSAFALYRHYHDPRAYKSPAWKETVTVIKGQSAFGDLLVYNFPEPAILYYNADELPVRLVPSAGGMAPQAIEAEIASLAADSDRLWLIPMPMPQWDAGGTVTQWLERHAVREQTLVFRGLEARLYRSVSSLLPQLEPVNAHFASGSSLSGYRLLVERGGDERVSRVRLVLMWDSGGPTTKPYTVFVHLVGKDGQIHGQQDRPPVSGTYPTTTWQVGERVVDQYEIELLPDRPAGRYEVRVGLYLPDTGERLPVQGENVVADYVLLTDTLLVD